MHQYLDSDSSGTGPDCGSPDTGADRLRAATAWLRSVGARAFLAEFGAGGDKACLQTLDRMLSYIDGNGDAWMGWSYWAAGPWWPERYAFSVQPGRAGADRPQMKVLRDHLARQRMPGKGREEMPAPWISGGLRSRLLRNPSAVPGRRSAAPRLVGSPQ
jgi:endoglucanase